MDLHQFFTNEVKPAMGCTEPVAVALATAEAASRLEGEPESIELALSLNIYKNGKDVGIPGTDGLHGNRVASALGALAGDSSKGLMVLENITADDTARAKAMVDAGKVSVSVDPDTPGVSAVATVRNESGEVMVAVRNRHDKISEVVVNGETVVAPKAEDTNPNAPIPDYLDELKSMGMAELWDLAGSIDDDLAAFMLKGVEMNMGVAEQGLNGGSWGLSVGLTIKNNSDKDDMLSRVKGYAGAAADVRMSGASRAVMSSAGSGNHGITAVVPVTVVARERNLSDRELAEAVALSHLVTGYVKAYTGRLTPICGCSVAAGAGAAAGLVRVLGGDMDQAQHAVASLLSSLMGMLCDGAKGSCGLKVSAAAGEAYTSALMALNMKGVQGTEGLVSPDLKSTCKSLGNLCSMAFANADEIMVKLMQSQD